MTVHFTHPHLHGLLHLHALNFEFCQIITDRILIFFPMLERFGFEKWQPLWVTIFIAMYISEHSAYAVHLQLKHWNCTLFRATCITFTISAYPSRSGSRSEPHCRFNQEHSCIYMLLLENETKYNIEIDLKSGSLFLWVAREKDLRQ